MAPTVVFDLDKVLLGGDASTLFLRGRLRQAPGRLVLLLLAAPLLVVGALIPQVRPLAARVMTRIALGGPAGRDVEAVAAAYGEALGRKPEAAVAEAIACVHEHQRRGDVVVVATGCEETLARGFLAAIGLGDLDVVGSTGTLWPPRVARGHGRGEGRDAHRPRVPTAVGRGLQRQRLGPAAVRRHPAAGAGQRREEDRPAGRAHAGPASGDPHLALSRFS